MEVIDEISEEIRKVLPLLNSDVVEKIATSLFEDGIKTVEDLALVEEGDLPEEIVRFDKRKLVGTWKKIKQSSNTEADHSQAQNSKEKVTVQKPSFSQGQIVGVPLKHSQYSIKLSKIPEDILTLLKNGKTLTKVMLDELVRVLVRDVRYTVPNVSRSFLKGVAKDMVALYPNSFSGTFSNPNKTNDASDDSNDDELNEHIQKKTTAKHMSGVEMLTYKMKNKYDNDNRRKKETMQLEAPNIPQAYGCKKWRVMEMPEGETTESLNLMVEELRNIYENQPRKEWDWQYINETMKTIYIFVRRDINTQSQSQPKRKRKRSEMEGAQPTNIIMSTNDIEEKYPFLFQYKGLLSHFHILTGVDFETKLEEWHQGVTDILVGFLSQNKPQNLKNKREMEKSIKKNHCDKKNAELICIMHLILSYLNEDSDFMLRSAEIGMKTHEVPQPPGTPCIYALGTSYYKSKKFYISFDGEVRSVVRTFAEALAMMFCFYFVFNLQYPVETANSIDFIQRSVADICPQSGSKVPRKKRGHTTIAYALMLLNTEYAAYADVVLESEDDSSEH